MLRPSLLPGLIDSCAHNRRRGRKDVQLFEIGSRFTSKGEGRSAAFAWTGAATPRSLVCPVRGRRFLRCEGRRRAPLRGVRRQASIGNRRGITPRLPRARTCGGGALEADLVLGVVGQLAPAIAEARGLPAGEELYVAEIDTEALARARRRRRPARPSRFRAIPPSSATSRSSSMKSCLLRRFVALSERRRRPTLVSIAEFDRYQGKGVPEGRVSLVAAADVPGSGSDADRRRSAGGD